MDDFFPDMRMSSSMYEVFNWNSSPDPCLTHVKNKRASLSLPPTTDIFAIDDKSDSDTRRATVQQAVSGEFQAHKKRKKFIKKIQIKNFYGGGGSLMHPGIQPPRLFSISFFFFFFFYFVCYLILRKHALTPISKKTLITFRVNTIKKR